MNATIAGFGDELQKIGAGRSFPLSRALTEAVWPDEVPADVRQAMRFHLASTVDQVLAVALEPRAAALAA